MRLLSLPLLYLVFVPSVLSLFTSELYDSQRLLQSGLLVVVVIYSASFRWRVGAQSIRGSWTCTVALLGCAGLGAVSAATSPNQVAAFQEWALWVLLALGISALSTQLFTPFPQQPCPISDERPQQQEVSRTLTMIAIVATAGLGLFWILTWLSFVAEIAAIDVFSTDVLWRNGFENQRFSAAYQMLFLPFVFWLWATKREWPTRWRAPLVVLGGFSLMLVVVSQSRATILFLFGFSLVLALSAKKLRRQWLAFVSLSFAAGTLQAMVMFVLPTQFGWTLGIVGIRSSVEAVVDLSFRDVLWRTALEKAISAPLFGVGPMQFAATGNFGIASHPHNIYLQIWSEWGTVVFGLLAWVAYSYAKRLRLAASAELPVISELSALVLAVFGGVALFSCVDGLWVYPVTQVQLLVWAAIMVAIIRVAERIHAASAAGLAGDSFPMGADKKDVSWTVSITTVGLAVLASAILIYRVPGQYVQQILLHPDYVERHPGYSLTPRFWKLGWFNYHQSVTRKTIDVPPGPTQRKVTHTSTLPPASTPKPA